MTVKQQVCGRESPRSLDFVRLALLGSPSGARCVTRPSACVTCIARDGSSDLPLSIPPVSAVLSAETRWLAELATWAGLEGAGRSTKAADTSTSRAGASPSRILNSVRKSLHCRGDRRITNHDSRRRAVGVDDRLSPCPVTPHFAGRPDRLQYRSEFDPHHGPTRRSLIHTVVREYFGHRAPLPAVSRAETPNARLYSGTESRTIL